MRLGILETGRTPYSLSAWGDYPAMFRALLGEDSYDYETYQVFDGAMPAGVEAADAWLITGSSSGVYDNNPWIGPLLDFLRTARGRAPLVGICFGHQAMAQAFGGNVIKSPKGWGVGLHRYQTTGAGAGLEGDVAVPAWHQDQVVEAPPGARVVGGNAFCPIGMLAYEGGISIQLHPEFQPAFVKAGLERRKMGLSEADTLAALASLEAPNDNARVGDWIRAFLRRAPSLG